jgi:hypothetical protein
MLSSQESSVTIMTTTGQTYIVPLDKLSGEDVSYVKGKKAKASMPEKASLCPGPREALDKPAAAL